MLKSKPPKVIVLGGEAFLRCLGHEAGTLMNAINAVIKDMSPPWSLLHVGI